MAWTVEYADTALKQLRRMPANVAARIRSKIEHLANDPLAPNAQVKPIISRPGVLRLRVGDWRVFYRLKGEELIVMVIEVVPRGNAYD